MKKISKPLRVPYALSAHGREEMEAVRQVIDEHRTIMGREVRQFESRVAKIFGKKFGIMVNSGSSANLLAFEILNLLPGSEVITPALTFSTTVAPIIQKGLVPVFVDVKPDTYLIDIDQIEKHISKKTCALMIPSLIGNIPDLKHIRNIAKKHKLYFIEDSCDTIGASFDGRPTGSYSDISTTSFYGSHVINAAGGGGLIAVNNPLWHKQLLVLRGWGRSSSLFSESEDIAVRFSAKLSGIPYDGKFIFTELGYNFLPLEVSAAFGLVQLKKLARFSKMRQKNFAALAKFFTRWPHYFETAYQTPGSRTNWLAFPIRIKRGAPFARLELVEFLEKRNIQTRPVFTGNVLRQPLLAGSGAGYASESGFPEADRVMRDSFLIGCHQSIGSREMAHIKGAVREFLKRYDKPNRKR